MTGNIKAEFEAAKPGWTMEEASYRATARTDAASDHTDMVGSDQSVLKKKYLPRGSKGTSGGSADATDPVQPTTDQDAWARIRDKDAPDSPVGSKAVLYDKKTNRPKAIQG